MFVTQVMFAKIKNTMSDRHVVQKKFNSLLEDYRLEILPVVIQEWGQLTATEQDHVSTLNNFFLWNACVGWDGRYNI